MADPARIRRAAADFRSGAGLIDQTPFEFSFRHFLEAYLPPERYRIERGRVLGDRADGPTLDCLLVDATSWPSIRVGAEGSFVPVDAVYGAIEIVDALDKKTLSEAAEAIASLKRIRRLPLVRNEITVNPYLGVVVAREGIQGTTLLEMIAQENQRRRYSEQIDLICLLDEGILAFVEIDPDGSITMELPAEASARWRLSWIPMGQQTLFGFFLVLWQTLGSRSLRSPSVHPLLRQLGTGEAHSLTEPFGVDPGE